MANFLRSLGNMLTIAVTILGLIALILKTLGPITLLIIFFVILILVFVALVVYQINNLEGRLSDIEEKYKRTKELEKIRADIKALELVWFGKMNKKGQQITSADVLEIIKIVILVIIGFIIIKALLGAG